MSDSIDARYQIVQERTLPVIASEIHQIERTVFGVAMDGAIQIGLKLQEAKAMIPAGEWVKWLNENLNYSQRQAYNFMEIADNYGDKNSPYFSLQTSANLSISKALELLRLPEETVEAFAEEHDIESETVKSLREEVAKVKAEKEAAERKATTLEGNNDSIRKELASMQRELAESVTEKEFNEMQAAAQAQKEDLTKELNEAKAESGAIQAKLDKAKEDLKKLKAKQKELEASKDEEVQKSIEAVRTEIVKKAKDDAFAESAADLEQNAKDIRNLQERIETLEAEKTKLSNTALMEFKVYVDQLQDIYDKLNDMITEESLKDEGLGTKMQMALQTVVGRWRP